MSDTLQVFVNERLVVVNAGATALDAVRAADPALAARVAAAEASLTDGRAVELSPGAVVAPGAIIRVVVSARRRDSGVGNAHA